jgi:hypothetical protein
MEFKNILPEPIIERITIQSLINLIFNIPDCQREKEWDDSMYSNAIDSIIKNIDIGQIILSKKNNLYEIIDGQHRYEALIKFMKGDIFVNDYSNNKYYFNENPELFLNKKITLCVYDNLTHTQKSQLYMRINSGIEQNIEHMEKINGANNIKDYLDKYHKDFYSDEVADLVLNTILFVLNDYYQNGEANVLIKNLTKKNHFLKNLNKLDDEFGTDSTNKILDLNEHILQQIFKKELIFYKKLKEMNKIKIPLISSIVYHIFHENYSLIKNKKFNFDKDIFYYNILCEFENQKGIKVKDFFNILLKSYNAIP